MKNIYLWGTLVIVAASVAFVVKFGLKPKPQRIIKPSNIEDFTKVGDIIFQHTFRVLDQSPILFFGDSRQGKSLEVLSGLLRTSEKVGKKFDTLIAIEPIVAEAGSLPIAVKNIKRESETILNLLREELSSGRRAIVWTIAGDVPHFHFENLVHLVEGSLDIKTVSIAQIPFVYGENSEDEQMKECRRQNNGNMNFKHLSCISTMKSKWMSRSKKVDRTKPVAIFERYGMQDYVLFLNMP